MKWPRGTAALSVALFGRTFDPNHREDGVVPRRDDEQYVVLGAGPVGLWTGIQLKLRLPSANVIIYEKRPAYTREHMVRLGGDALWWSTGRDQEEIKQIVEVQSSGHGMKLQELERLLRGLAERLGIVFIEKNITDGHELLTDHPDAVAVIGADGRHSILRESLFAEGATPASGKPEEASNASAEPLSTDLSPSEAKSGSDCAEHITKRVIEHTIYMNFKLAGANALAKHNLEGGALQNIVFNAADSVLHAGHYPVRLVVGRKKDDEVSLTAIFFIDHETAQSMSTCNKRNPGKVQGDERVPEKLSSDIRRYLTERFGAGAVDFEELKLSYIAIDRYCSNVIAQTRSNAGIYLVGDACFGVPYFRALTNGLKCASTLAHYLSMPGVTPSTSVRAYRWYVFRLWQQALSAAEVTGLGSFALGGVVHLGQRLVAPSSSAASKEEAEEETRAQAQAEEEERVLETQGFTNHRCESNPDLMTGGDAFGERGGAE
eukprot:CAMPEP_0181315332 /NCGR_PEP_ID=MMETSP1101-20121128/15318_1 /TAXON_ID=46948 /ORGANISM="Rhodomonas abbreviata, Strain Caron Lab Isolate" /LENGTH=489 /DNA_ID=CAMNT_0023422531 /DNA_START=45 /DNA_END=1511 /DNA_ORIENTATION=-